MERRETRCRDLDSLSGLGIAAITGFALARFKGPEAGDLHFLPGYESGGDQALLAGGEKRLDCGARLACRKTGLLCYGGDEFGLVHVRLTSFGLNDGGVNVRRTPGGVKYIPGAGAAFPSKRVLDSAEPPQAARSLLVVDLREVLHVDLEVVL